MSDSSDRLSWFWEELKRRKVLPILIAYLAACFAIIEFADITSNRFSIPDGTFNLLYILAVIGLPLAVILPWYIYRKKLESIGQDEASRTAESSEYEAKGLHNLPVQVTNFIGRDKEMPLLKKLIDEHRIITLAGAGGCGKTRLAIEVARQIVQEFKDGIWFVDLAPITSEDQVSKEITEVLGIQEVPNQSIVDTLIGKIKNKNLLIILDNCEHLVKACAEIVGKLIQAVPGLKILVTSREILCVKGEQVWRVPSLTLIDPKTILNVEHAKDSEAVTLFTDRAQLNNPEFELETANVNEVVTICNKLDGIPLALELVASRTRHMNPQMILERFSDRFEQLASTDPGTSMRQKTLQATIEWSHNLLSESEQLLFSRLSVFNGGFDIRAAEEICSDDHLSKEVILESLSKLVDRSMVYTRENADHSMRYYMLETLRQFAGKVQQSMKEDDDLNKKHLKYFLSIAQDAYDGQFESQSKWLKQLTVEQDNLLAATAWSFNNSTSEYIKLIGRLSWYWIMKSKYQTCKENLEKAISLSTQDNEDKARLLYGMGIILFYFGESVRAASLCEESVKIWRRKKNPIELATALAYLGYIHQVLHKNTKTGSAHSDEALAIARKIDKPGIINHCLYYYCSSLVHSKQFEQAIPYVEELIISSEKLNQPWGIMIARHLHSDCALGTNDYIEAEKRYSLGIRTGVKYGSDWFQFIDMQGAAFALSGQSRWAKCIRLNAASVEKARSIGMNTRGLFEFWDEWIDTYIEGAMKKVSEELAKQYEEEGIAMGFEKAVEYALDFEKD